VAQLCQNEEQFEQLKTRIVIISFGTLPAVQAWMKESCVTFQIALDRERTVYTAYGLERSFWRSRNLKTRWYYFKAWLSGKKGFDSHGDDTSQLGGDFIVDKNGVLRLVYPSHDPTDRPSAEYLLERLQQLQV
jgi:peroxiredoxin